MARLQESMGFPGNDWLGGTTDPPWVKKPRFFEDWLREIPGGMVEMCCHPGYRDENLIGRDCTAYDGLMQRRVDELRLLQRPEFFDAVAEAGFELTSPEQFMEAGVAHAA
jgi:hypothetical protein